MAYQNELSPIIADVQERYIQYRRQGKTRAAATELIRADYAQELQDEDDRIGILIGLSLSLCRKKELFEPIATETLCEIQRLSQQGTLDKAAGKYLAKIENRLRNKVVYGDEAPYRSASVYVPPWEIGDVFSHAITYPTADALGINGWFALLYKVGEYVDEFEKHRQLVYVSICPPDKIPSCPKDLQALGFLPMMRMGDRAEYLAQIMINSKKGENDFELTKIGCFPNVPHPGDSRDENPLTAMPLFGRLRKTDLWPRYEDLICRLYRKSVWEP